jgi:hypothetical protein
MLQKLTEHIANALERAAEAEQRAADTPDPGLRADNQNIARSWRTLARSFEFVESLERFLIDAQTARDLLPPEPPDER